jgi:hypothetical protein
MRFIRELRSECPRDERLSPDVFRPPFTECACEREQHRTPCQRDHLAPLTHDVTASVDDECFRCQQFFDLCEQEESLLVARNQTRSGRAQDAMCAFDLRSERRDACMAGFALRPNERGARRLRPEASHRYPCNHQLVRGPRRSRKEGRVELGERTLRLIDASEQEKAPDLEIAGMGGVYAIAVLFECRPRCRQRLRGPAQVARNKCDLGLGDDASRMSHRLFPTKGPASASEERLCSNEIAELRHRDASKCESRRVVAQGDPLQCGERITYRQRSCRGSNHRVHRNRVILVTLTVRCPVLRLFHDQSPRDSGNAK